VNRCRIATVTLSILLAVSVRGASPYQPSGHFKKVVSKKGVGFVEYASGYGAKADGFRLKREK
jgi:hypothetical protein